MGSRDKMAAYKPAARRNSKCLDFVRSLVDEASFVEQDSYLSSSGNANFERPAVPGDGLISGCATIADQQVFLAVQDNKVFKGAVGLVHAEKFAKVCKQALETFSPFIAVLDSGGVRAEEGLNALKGVGLMLKAIQEAKELIPIIVIIRGPVAGALSLISGLADALIVIEENGGLFLHGPGVTLAKEESTEKPQDIGGASTLARSSGTVALSAKNDQEVSSVLRKLLSYSNSSTSWFDELSQNTSTSSELDLDPNRIAPELNAIAADSDKGLDTAKVIEAIFDNASLLPLYENYAPELFCGLGRLANVPLAIVAEQGERLGLTSGAKLKRFLTLAQAFRLPLVTITNSAGFLDGSDAERQGMLLSASTLSEVFSNYPNVMINLYIGKSYGSHLLAFNSKYQACDRAYAWPTAELGLLTAEQALNLFGKTDLEKLADPISERSTLEEANGQNYTSPELAASAGLIDEIIMPEASRPYLYSALQALWVAQ